MFIQELKCTRVDPRFQQHRYPERCLSQLTRRSKQRLRIWTSAGVKPIDSVRPVPGHTGHVEVAQYAEHFVRSDIQRYPLDSGNREFTVAFPPERAEEARIGGTFGGDARLHNPE
jgi:hypothetical protein